MTLIIGKKKTCTNLGASDHHAIVESQMKYSLAMMNQGIDHIARNCIPHAYCTVRRAGYDDFVIVLQTQYGSSVSSKHLGTLKIIAIPNFDGIVT